MRIFKNAAGSSENSSDITAGWSEGLVFALHQWEKLLQGTPEKTEKSLLGGLKSSRQTTPPTIFSNKIALNHYLS